MKRRQSDLVPRWKVFDDKVLLGYAETNEAAWALGRAYSDREVLRWALAAGAGFVTWDEAARRAGYREGATWAFKQRVAELMPRSVE